MIIDKALQFCDRQALTGSAASENTLDFVAANIGQGEPIHVSIQVVEAFQTLTSLAVALQASSDDGDTDPYANVVSSAAVPVADLKPGYEFVLTVLPDKLKRYGQLYFTVNGSDATAGRVSAHVIADPEQMNLV